MKKYFVIKHIIFAFLTLGYYYLVLPPLNLRSPIFWISIVMLSAIYLALGIPDMIRFGIDKVRRVSDLKGFPMHLKAALVLGLVSFLTIPLGLLAGAEIFHAKDYYSLIKLEDGDFASDVAEISMSQIPLVDRDTAASLGSRKLGAMAELVSQFEVAEDYTQINYGGRPVRVTPLEYGDLIKWFNNRSEGIPAYIRVDMASQETSLVKLEEGIRYSASEHFSRNIHRFLRFHYPTKIFEALSFEIDENGTPYWVAPTVSYTIGLFSGEDITGAVLVNAITGENSYYDLENVPSWVDRVFNADLIMDQLTYNGRYSLGYWNSKFGQKNVLAPTDGYNYLAVDDDVYIYTGITSVGSDESNVGFVLINSRTKDAHFYRIPGAEEYSAMSSAQGQVQHLNYRATFPILLNVMDRPSYFVSLKDGAGLVKMYAFVDVQQYQIVGTGVTVADARADYLHKLGVEEEVAPEPEFDTAVIEGVVSEIASAVKDGMTYYYMMIGENIYLVPVDVNVILPFIGEGDLVKIEYIDTEGPRIAVSFERESRFIPTPKVEAVEPEEVTEVSAQ